MSWKPKPWLLVSAAAMPKARASIFELDVASMRRSPPIVTVDGSTTAPVSFEMSFTAAAAPSVTAAPALLLMFSSAATPPASALTFEASDAVTVTGARPPGVSTLSLTIESIVLSILFRDPAPAPLKLKPGPLVPAAKEPLPAKVKASMLEVDVAVTSIVDAAGTDVPSSSA